MTKIGFIGLGIMGAPMAGHLQAAGTSSICTRTGKMPAGALVEGGATVCTSATRGGAERADIIFVMVPDTPRRGEPCCSAKTASQKA